METQSKSENKTFRQKVLPWIIAIPFTLAGLGAATGGYFYLKLPNRNLNEISNKVLYYASQNDNKPGMSVGDFRNLEQKFYETDLRHAFAESYTGGRMQPYIGNPAIKMRGITSWNDPNDKRLSISQRWALEEVLYHAAPEELNRVIEAYQNEKHN